MKNTNILFAVIVGILLAGCLDEEVEVPNVQITPNQTTISPGDTITFSIAGDPNHIVFYSGEFGSRYLYRDSSAYNASLQMSWGSLGTFGTVSPADMVSLWYSTDFVDFSEFDTGEKTPFEHLQEATWTEVTDANFSSTISGNPSLLRAPTDGSLAPADLLYDTLPSLGDIVKAPKVNFAFKLNTVGAFAGNLGIGYYRLDAISESLPNPIAVKRKIDGWRSITAVPENGAKVWRDFPGNPEEVWQIDAGSPADKEMWLVLNAVNTERDVLNVPSDKGEAIKNSLTDNFEEYQFIYNEVGTYKATFLVTQASATGEKFESQLFEFDITVSDP